MSDTQLDNVLDDGSPSLGYMNNNRYALEVKLKDPNDETKTVTQRIHLLIDWGDLENIPNILYYELLEHNSFPSIGRTDTLYIATDENMIYRFDVGSGQYIGIGGGGGGSGSVVQVDDDDVVILELENKGSIQKITALHAKVGANVEVGSNEEKEITREGSFLIPKIKVDEYGHVTEATDVNVDIKIPDTTEMIKGEGSAHRIAKFADDSRRKIVDSGVVIKNETYVDNEESITAPAIYYEQIDKGLLGKAENQWGRAYVKEIFENGESLESKYAGKSMFELHKHKYTPKGSVTSTFTGTEFKITPLFIGKTATISYEYTPQGTVSQPIFTGSEGSGSVEYTPKGTVDQPTFTGSELTSTGKFVPVGTVSQPTFKGDSLTSTGKFTPTGTISAPTITVIANTTTVNSITDVGTLPELKTTYTENTQTLKFSWSAGTLPTKGSNTTVATGIKSATSSQPIFTGAEGNVSVQGTPTGSVSQPVFTGTEGNISVKGTPAGTVSQPDFTGTKETIIIKVTPTGTISQPTFTGTKITLAQDYTPEGTINEISHTPAGTITSTFTGQEDETTTLIE